MVLDFSVTGDRVVNGLLHLIAQLIDVGTDIERLKNITVWGDHDPF